MPNVTSWYQQASLHSRPLQLPANTPRIILPTVESQEEVQHTNVQYTTGDEGSRLVTAGKKRKVGHQLQVTRRKKPIPNRFLVRSLKIRVYPNARQKTILKEWMG